MHTSIKSVLALAGMVLASGCTIVPGLHVREGSPGEQGGYRVVEVNPIVVASLNGRERITSQEDRETLESLQGDNAYRIGPGDILTVIVWDHPELTNPTGEFRDPESSGRLVLADGTMYYPYVGSFLAAGKTVAEVRAHLAQALSKNIQAPQVDVRVAGYRSQRVQVTGSVREPGMVAINDTAKTVLDAINERGGLAPDGSKRTAVLRRSGKTYLLDTSRLLSGDGGAVNPVVRPGDVVHVPDNGMDRIFVLGEVRNSAPVVMSQAGMTLTEALSMSGGLDKFSSDDSGVLVFRRGKEESDSIPTIYALNLGSPQGMLLAGEFPLAPRDVVYVKATAFSKYNSVINQLLPTITAVFQVDRLVND